ncbi:cyclophilin-like fold protein [Microbacterium sp. P01]|uniref:cyclophilin-like fold protein n=1 Tax=Microbacterium sp. P01 TaxID=3366261 RepID=UPI00366EFB68
MTTRGAKGRGASGAWSAAGFVGLLAALAACASAAPESGPAVSFAPTSSEASVPTPTSPTTAASSDSTEGTIVRFTSARTSVDVVMGESTPAVRDFLASLPLELSVEDLDGAEKIAYLPRALEHSGSPGSDPEDGDLIYYVPWGNVGFYYDATGIGSSDATLHLGTYAADPDQLALLEGAVSVVLVG